MMPTNEERREVASQIRESVELFEMVGAGCPDYQALIMKLMNLNPDSTSGKNRRSGLLRLADLIDPEPTVDRDALLDIAKQMEWASEASYEEVGVVSGGIVGAWAEKIKEACGEVNNHEV